VRHDTEYAKCRHGILHDIVIALRSDATCRVALRRNASLRESSQRWRRSFTPRSGGVRTRTTSGYMQLSFQQGARALYALANYATIADAPARMLSVERPSSPDLRCPRLNA
jgi:hypothetical protein